MTNYEEFEKGLDEIRKIGKGVTNEMQQTIYLGCIAQFLVKIADVLEQNTKFILKADGSIEQIKTGHWISDKNGQYCDKCGNGINIPYNFCPFCGADMRENTAETPTDLENEDKT